MAVNNLTPFVAANAVAVTPSDTTDLNFMSLYVGTTGNLSIITANAASAAIASGLTIAQAITQGLIAPVAFPNVPVGFFPVAGARVMATGTTAGGIVAVF